MKKDIALIHIGRSTYFPNNMINLIPHLVEENISFSVIDLSQTEFFKKKKFEIKHICSFLSNIKEDIIAISCMVNMLPLLILALIELKAKHPNKKIILGGSGPNNGTNSIIEKFGHVIDFIVVGVGDFVFPKLVRKLLDNETNFEDLPGICFKKDDNVICSQPKFLPDYFDIKDKIPIEKMGFEYFDINKYNYFPLITSKGCPYQCSFCSLNHNLNFGNKLIHGNIKKTIEIISYLNSKSPDLRFFIVDEAFVCNKKRLDAFCDSVKKEKNNPKLSLYGRVNLMNEELMKKLSSSGFDDIYYGIESGSNKVLQKIRKGFTIEEAVNIVLKSRKYFNCVTASMIWGFPFESMKDFMDSALIFQYFKAKKIIPQFHLLAPFMNSVLFKEYSKTLKFDENIISDIASNIGWAHNKNDELQKVIRIVKENKDIFPYYFYYDDDNINEKKEYLKEMGIAW